jgi:hypothetical protein
MVYDLQGQAENTYRITQGAVNGPSPDPPGFTDTASIPSKTGNAVRQARFQSNRAATARRNLIRWFVPETGIVEMFVNPSSIKYTEKKVISETRTRGGYVLQYWGEELETLNITGNTASSGIEGINVLRDIYRNEQVSTDPLAIALTAYREKQNATAKSEFTVDNFFGGVGNLLQGAADDVFRSVNNLVQYGNINPSVPRPTLASMAFTVEMYWSGWVFRGYFTDCAVDETADSLGLFNYHINFKVTQMRGWRNNFMPWHRSAVNGPSNSDPQYGRPYSFAYMKRQTPQPNIVGGREILPPLLTPTTGIDPNTEITTNTSMNRLPNNVIPIQQSLTSGRAIIGK